MILVILGTQPQRFDRLIKIIDKFASNIPEQEIIIQCGKNKYSKLISSENIKLQQYIEDYEQKIKKTDLVITHGGVGSIMDGLLNQKKVFAIARLLKYSEHLDDHQVEIVHKLNEDNYLYSFENIDELTDLYENIDRLYFKEYESNNKIFNKMLNELVQEIL